MMRTKWFQRENAGSVNEIILLQDNASPHKENLMRATLATVGWEIMNHHLYGPDLARQ
jgi:hypothetical protein